MDTVRVRVCRRTPTVRRRPLVQHKVAKLTEEIDGRQEQCGNTQLTAVQGLAAKFISKLSGSYSGVMGLPLYETTTLLRQCGLPD